MEGISHTCHRTDFLNSQTQAIFFEPPGIKTALDIRDNVNNEIVYIESNKFPLECRIKKMQLKFWLYLQEYVGLHPTSAISKVLQMGESVGISLIKHYKSLSTSFKEPQSCQETLQNAFRSKWRNLLTEKVEADMDSRLGTYFRLNPDLKPYVPQPQFMLESERKLVTRFRTGSHSLNIETGRYSNIPRENRLCSCGEDVQTIWHIINGCPLTADIANSNFENLQHLFQDEDIHKLLLVATKRLKIPLGRL